MRWLTWREYRTATLSSTQRLVAYALLVAVAVVLSWFTRHTLLPFAIVAAAMGIHYLWVCFLESPERNGHSSAENSTHI